MPFALFLALKYLKPKRSFTSVVTVISVLGVVLGVAIIIIVRAVMTGFGDMWREKILAFKPHITIRAEQGVIQHEDALCHRIEAIPGVLAASPGIESRVLAEFHHRILAPVAVGVDPGHPERLHQAITNLVDGSLALANDGVLVGIDLAGSLGLRVGDKLLVHSPMNLVKPDEVRFPEELEVRGIFQAGQRDVDADFILVPLSVARDLMGMDKGALAIHIKTDRPQDIQAFAACVAAVQQVLGKGYRVQTWQEIDRELFNALAVEKNMMVILLMFITVVAIFCVTNTLIVITVQKTDEIGLLKALGFSSRQVLWTFVLHGWMQCLAGAVLGIGLAMLVLTNLQHVVDFLGRCGLQVFPKSIYGLDQIPWRVVPTEIAQVAVAVILFCSLASFLPAWRASRMDPVVALRRE